VASRVDDDGVLVLSQFAGAARELPEAILVNPYDVHGTADAMNRALRMSAAERQSRMRALRQRVEESDVRQWALHFLASIGAAGAEHGATQRRTGRAARSSRSVSRPTGLMK
jgi:trehalose-6-phosphate synthase